MKKLRFKRGITVGIIPKESITVPNNEYWRVLPAPGIAIYSKDGKAGYDEPLFTIGGASGKNPQTVILPPGTILYSVENYQYDTKTKRSVIGLAFEEVESV